MAREVKIIIGAETSKYERAMRDVKMTTRQTTSFISSAWFKAAGAFYTLIKAQELAKLAAQAEQEAASFANLAASYGASAEDIIEQLKRASAHTVDTMTLVQKAGTAMMMGISPDKIAKLMEIARATSRQTGQTVVDAFSDITMAVGRQSRMILDNLGIIVKVGDANEQYAKQLGKTSAELTDVEKKQAFLNATVDAGEGLMKRLGDQTKTTAEMFQSFEAMIKDLKIWVGQGLLFISKWITIAFTEAGVIINQTLEQIFSGWGHIMLLLGKLPGGEKLGFKALGDDLSQLGLHFKLARIEGEKFVSSLINMKKPEVAAIIPGGMQAPPEAPDGKNAQEIERQTQMDRLRLWRQEEDLFGQHLAAKMALQEEAALKEIELEEGHLERVWELWQNEEQSIAEHLAVKLQMNEEAALEELQREEQLQRDKIAMAENASRTVMNIQTVAAQFSGKTAKAVFLVTRGYEIAKATIAAFAAFNQALAAPPGAPYTIPMAAFALAAGLTNVAAIAATTYGQMSGGGVSASPGGGGSVTTVPAPEPLGPVQGETRPVTQIIFEGDVRIEDEAYIEELAEKISDAVEGRDVRLVASNSRLAESLA